MAVSQSTLNFASDAHKNLVGNKKLPPFFEKLCPAFWSISVGTSAETALVCGPTEEFSKTFTHYCSYALGLGCNEVKSRFWSKFTMPHQCK